MTQAFPVTRLVGRALVLLARIASIILSLALLTIPLQSRAMQDVSEEIKRTELDSFLLKVVTSSGLSAALALVMLTYLIVRFKMIPNSKKRTCDLLYFLGAVSILAFYQAVMYLPVIRAPLL